jgi:uroporphyrinogen III methyltransferase/synthase
MAEPERSVMSAMDRVRDLLVRDFPSATPDLSAELADLRSGVARAVVVPAARIDDLPAEGLDSFAFPAEAGVGPWALVFRAGDALLRSLRRFYLPPVVFAGAGPGGRGSMTHDAARAVARADVILADCLCGEEVLEGCRADAEVVPVGKRCGRPSTKQEEINRRLDVAARRGLRVVRLKGGDPCVFGRLEEEIAVLDGLGLSYRVIPGVGSASAAAAVVGQPLTVRQVATEVIFSTGRLAGGGRNLFPLEGSAAPAIALYMSRKVLGERAAALVSAGYPADTPVVVMEKIGSPEARAVAGTLQTIAGVADREGVGTPAVVLVGAHFHAPGHLPLAGVRIWLPAERETAESQRIELEELGATCVCQPLIEPVGLEVDTRKVFTRPYDWVLFTSKKSVDFFFDLLHRWGFDSRWLPRVAAIGEPTIEKLRARGIEPDLIPPEPTRVALSSSLIRLGLAGKRVLMPASAVAPDHVREALRPHAGEFVRVDLYTIRYPRVETVPTADVVLFTSETTVKSARENGLIEEIRRRGMAVGGIGPATCRRLADEDLPAAIVPEGTSPRSLARATHRTFARLTLAVEEALPR